MFELLSIPLVELNPAEKYFLVRLVNSYRKTLLIPLSAEKLAEKFGVSVPVARSVLNRFLVEEECVQKVRGDAVAPQGSQMTGRPPFNYRFHQERLQKLLAKVPVYGTTGKHQSLISDVLGGAGFKNLPPRHRLLLAVMLHYSDECGAVRGLGISDLGSLASMKRDRCKKSLQELMEKEFIVAYSPGATGALLFGATPGMYLLNLERFYDRKGPLSVEARWTWKTYKIAPEEIDFGHQLVKKARELERYRHRLANWPKIESLDGGPAQLKRYQMYKSTEDACEHTVQSLREQFDYNLDEATLLHFFRSQSGGADVRLLQLKLEQYACDILGRGIYAQFADGDFSYLPVFRQLQKDVVPKTQKGAGSDRSEYYLDVAAFLYRCAHTLARRVEFEVWRQRLNWRANCCAVVIAPPKKGKALRRIVEAHESYRRGLSSTA